MSTDDLIRFVLADHPDIADHLTAAHAEAWRAVDPVVLELCRLRVAMLLGCGAELGVRTALAGVDEDTIAELAQWPTSSRYGPRERACLAFCEQFVIDVAGLDDEVALAVRSHLGEEGLANLATALLVIEQRQRLRLAWARLFPSSEEAA